MTGLLKLIKARIGCEEEQKGFQRIICVDFDGVIHDYKGWVGIDVIDGKPVDGSIEWLMNHLPTPEQIDPFSSDWGDYYNLGKPMAVIYSSRSKTRKGRDAMKGWLIKHGLPKWYITEDILKFPTKKPPAFLAIDDRAICFTGSFPSDKDIISFKPWNKS